MIGSLSPGCTAEQIALWAQCKIHHRRDGSEVSWFRWSERHIQRRCQWHFACLSYSWSHLILCCEWYREKSKKLILRWRGGVATFSWRSHGRPQMCAGTKWSWSSSEVPRDQSGPLMTEDQCPMFFICTPVQRWWSVRMSDESGWQGPPPSSITFHPSPSSAARFKNVRYSSQPDNRLSTARWLRDSCPGSD